MYPCDVSEKIVGLVAEDSCLLVQGVTTNSTNGIDGTSQEEKGGQNKNGGSGKDEFVGNFGHCGPGKKEDGVILPYFTLNDCDFWLVFE